MENELVDFYKALGVLPIDIGGAGFQPYGGDVAERDIGGLRFRIGIRSVVRSRQGRLGRC